MLAAMLVNAYVTLRQLPALGFPHVLLNRRDRTDPELGPHLHGFMGYVMGGGKRPMSQTRFHVLLHLGRVQHHLSLEVDSAHRPAFEAWARAANALVFTTDGQVRDPSGAILVDGHTGDPDEGAALPYPADAVRRKQATADELRARGVSTPTSLPPVPGEGEVELRAPADVARRCLALFACAVRAESLASGDPIGAEEVRARLPLGFEAMSPRERAFMATEAPAEQAIVDHAWRYESLAVLWWALGGLPTLPFPSTICDVPALAKAMLHTPGEAIVARARLRPAAEVLDALDLTYRLAWAANDARANQQQVPADLEPGVVAERHHALNWLTCFEDADWDDVNTPT